MLLKNEVKAVFKLKRAYNLHKSCLKEDSTNSIALKSVAVLSIILNEMNQYSKFAGTLVKAEWPNQKSWDVLAELKRDRKYELEISILEILLAEFVLYDFQRANGLIKDLLFMKTFS